MNRLAKIAALLIVTGLTPAQAAPVPPALPDQLGGSGELADYANAPVLVIVVSARRLRHVQRWEESLRAELPELLSMRIADIGQEPKPQLADVASKLAKRAPPDAPILIDMNNAWATQYALNTREPCLLLFDADRELVAQWRGRARPELVSEVLAGIRTLGVSQPGSTAGSPNPAPASEAPGNG